MIGRKHRQCRQHIRVQSFIVKVRLYRHGAWNWQVQVRYRLRLENKGTLYMITLTNCQRNNVSGLVYLGEWLMERSMQALVFQLWLTPLGRSGEQNEVIAGGMGVSGSGMKREKSEGIWWLEGERQ